MALSWWRPFFSIFGKYVTLAHNLINTNSWYYQYHLIRDFDVITYESLSPEFITWTV